MHWYYSSFPVFINKSFKISTFWRIALFTLKPIVILLTNQFGRKHFIFGEGKGAFPPNPLKLFHLEYIAIERELIYL